MGYFLIGLQEFSHILLLHSITIAIINDESFIKTFGLEKKELSGTTKNMLEKYPVFSQVTFKLLLSATSFIVFAMGFNLGAVSKEVKTLE